MRLAADVRTAAGADPAAAAALASLEAALSEDKNDHESLPASLGDAFDGSGAVMARSSLSRLGEKVPYRGEGARAFRPHDDEAPARDPVPLPPAERVEKARALRERPRAADIEPAFPLSRLQKRDLSNLLSMLGIRRSRVDRFWQRTKALFGGASLELEPIIQAGKNLDPLGDEARLILNRFNERAKLPRFEPEKSFEELTDGLFRLYETRERELLDDPFFVVDGVRRSVLDFVNMDAYRQLELSPSNRWMNVGRIKAADVRMPQLKGLVDREMWWNRGGSINAIGTIRISRNFKVAPDGTETLVSVEVLRRGPGKVFIPYLFLAGPDGQLHSIRGGDAKRTMLACYGCHLRLSGIFFGGITQAGYEPAPGWYINAIDFTRFRYYRKFWPLVR